MGRDGFWTPDSKSPVDPQLAGLPPRSVLVSWILSTLLSVVDDLSDLEVESKQPS